MFNPQRQIEKILYTRFPDWSVVSSRRDYKTPFHYGGFSSYLMKSPTHFTAVILPTRKFLWLSLGLDFSSSAFKKLEYYVEHAIANKMREWSQLSQINLSTEA